MKREPYKDVEIGGRKWRIGRFDALTGSYIATLLLMQMLPMGLDEKVSGGALASLSKDRSLMDKATFMSIQIDCLKVISEIQSIGGVATTLPILLVDGRWAVPDLENDLITVLALTVHTLIFNISDFFQEDALKDLGATFQGTSLFSAKG